MATLIEIQDPASSLIDAIEKMRRGEEVVIADHGQAIAKLTPVEPATRVLGAFKGRGKIADDFDAPLPPDLLAEFEK